MANAERDENRVTVAMGDYNGTTVSLMIDNATGYLKASILNSTLSNPSSIPTVAPRDDNRVRVSLGLNGTTPTPLFVDNSTGYLKAVNS